MSLGGFCFASHDIQPTANPRTACPADGSHKARCPLALCLRPHCHLRPVINFFNVLGLLWIGKELACFQFLDFEAAQVFAKGLADER
jgi:hypothetical protein